MANCPFQNLVSLQSPAERFQRLGDICSTINFVAAHLSRVNSFGDAICRTRPESEGPAGGGGMRSRSESLDPDESLIFKKMLSLSPGRRGATASIRLSSSLRVHSDVAFEFTSISKRLNFDVTSNSLSN